jgi:exopolyphosphatase/guanosine-5'-triphosphate,3'-diphosphate pyrophosphatase
VIAIDLGSNTIRFLTADKNGRELWEAQFVVRTAENLVSTGVISDAALERVANAIDEAKKRFDFSKHTIAAVATQSFRQAKNQKEALKFLRDSCGVDFEVISPETEALLAARAACESAQKSALKPPFITIDVGGASSEVAYINGARFAYESLPIGVVTLTERGFDDGFLYDAVKRLEVFKEEIRAYTRPNALIATAGAPTTLAAIKLGLTYENYDKKIVNATSLYIAEIADIRDELKSLDRAEQERLTGKDRGDLTITGAAILLRIMDALNYDRVIVFDEGLREGVLSRAFNSGAKIRDIK